jgi:hypothetical protein
VHQHDDSAGHGRDPGEQTGSGSVNPSPLQPQFLGEIQDPDRPDAVADRVRTSRPAHDER